MGFWIRKQLAVLPHRSPSDENFAGRNKRPRRKTGKKNNRDVHWLIVHVSSPFKHSDLLLVRQQQRDVVFVIPIVDPRVSERSGQMVLLPVVVPVPVLVGAEAKHADLEQMENTGATMSRVPTSTRVDPHDGPRGLIGLTSSQMWMASSRLRKPVEG